MSVRWRRRFERLGSTEDLARWCVEGGVLSSAARFTAADLHAVRQLREVIYAAALAGIAGENLTDDARRMLNEAAARPPLIPRLDGDATTWVTGPHPGTALLSSLARDAIDVLGGKDAQRLRHCASPSCSLIFIDTSRPGQRRWCSSAGCGGAARAAAYRRRRGTDEQHLLQTRGAHPDRY
jgi:predicted RNA-binding Zn ribbon-like protein